jgi:hypothetical protein
MTRIRYFLDVSGYGFAMTKLIGNLAVAALLFAVSTPLLAQWPPYPTPNVPRTADGEPDLDGPVPRTEDGQPDLSGIWELDRMGGGGGPNAVPQPRAPGEPPFATFWNLGAGFEDDLPFRPWARELRDERVANDMKDNPDAHCLPMGHMQMHMHPQPRKIIQTPDVMVILYEGNAGVRQIFLDGRPLPDNDPQPWWYGYSIGNWDGDTLVVETVGFRDGGWLDVQGSPLTDEGKLIERFTRLDYGHLQIDVTVDDPKAYTEPFTVRVRHRVMLDTDLIEFICNENEKSTQHFDP